MEAYFEQLEQAMMQTPSFDGQAANLTHITNANGMTATFMDIGATWLSCTLPLDGEHREVLLRSPNMVEHIKQDAYFGAVVGRFVNRIANGRFEIDGEHYQLGVNNGENSLHGGLDGFDKRRWNITEQSAQQVVFTLHSPDDDQGYPGNLDVTVTYLPTDAGLIPTGEQKPVSATSFDFTEPKPISQAFLTDQDQKTAGGYDHAFVLKPEVTDGVSVAAVLTAPKEDVVMKVKTTKPAIQFYTGNFLAGVPGASKTYALHDGLALETRYYPDGPNKPEWGLNSGVLSSGDCYQHRTVYQFEF